MSSIDKYFGAVYNRKTFNCLHFTAKVWASETSHTFQGIYDFLNGKCALSTARRFKKLDKPISPCIVVFKGGLELHIGVYLRGKVLHICPDGVQYQPLDLVSIGFTETKFYHVQ
jgi:hypothetical protein